MKALGFSNSIIGKIIGCGRNTVLYHTNQNYRNKCRIRGGRGMGKRLDGELLNKILEMIKDGVSGLEISRRVGVHPATVYRYKNPLKRKSDNERCKKYKKKEHCGTTIKRERGGKCELCGFDKHYNCLDFHHKIPSEKLFQISHGHGRSIETIREEAAKCVLVCKNCHYLIHAGVIQLPLD